MAQILDPLPNNHNNPLLCCYVNVTSQIQVARITNLTNWYFERVVFPGQRLVFEALPGALLEIHSGMMASAILSDTIPCERLCVDEQPVVEIPPVSATMQTKSDNKQNIETIDHKSQASVESWKTAISLC
jgi:Domain of unknown function (DUF1830)